MQDSLIVMLGANAKSSRINVNQAQSQTIQTRSHSRMALEVYTNKFAS